jgi:hypothetical protein
MTSWREKFINRPISAIVANPSEATAIGTVILAIATLILAVIAIVTLERTEAITKQAERAWISPLGVVLQENIEENKPIRFVLLFTNTGKQPAFDVVFRHQNAVIRAPGQTDWSGFVVEKNTTCEGLEPSIGALTVYPNNIGPVGTSIRAFDSAAGINPITATRSIVDGTFTYYVRGCASYKTFGETHHSAFCYAIFHSTTAAPQAAVPPTTPQIPQPPQSQNFFVHCPSGFDAN